MIQVTYYIEPDQKEILDTAHAPDGWKEDVGIFVSPKGLDDVLTMIGALEKAKQYLMDESEVYFDIELEDRE